MQNKLDRRVERTKRDFKSALLHLIEEKKNIKSITITEITKIANYNRATFYAHYTDKKSLFDEIMEDAIAGFIDSYREPFNANYNVINTQNLTRSAIKIFEYIEINSSLFLLLFNNNFFPGFQQKLCYAIEEKIHVYELNFIGKSSKNINKDLNSRIQMYSLIGVIDFWIENDFEYSSKYMSEQFLQRIHNSPTIIKIKNKNN